MKASRCKYRAWDKKRGQMIKKAIPVPNGVFVSGYCCSGDVEFVTLRSDSRFVLMQSTGLVDADGKEIYEGDILAIGDRKGALGVVAWSSDHDPCFMLELLPKRIARSWNMGERAKDDFVVGNIFENSALCEPAHYCKECGMPPHNCLCGHEED